MKKYLVRSTIIASLACAVLMGAASARTPLLRELEQAFISLNEEVGPSVVNITVKGAAEETPPQLENFFRMYGIPMQPEGQRPRAPRSLATGSGFIYDASGHIVTNNHVVEGAASIMVRLQNGNEYLAEIVGTDPDSDLAVIKIDADEKLSVAKLANSDELKVGQFAIALGSPRGFEGSLSFGHISALGRDGLDGLAMQGLAYQDLIQTDAAINLGNSGGPLVNIDGEVIGINMAIVYGANSIGFAIPANTARHAVPLLIADGKVTRGFIGVNLGVIDADLAAGLELPDKAGALVNDVVAGPEGKQYPGERAGLQAYDVIRKVDSQKIDDYADLQRRIGRVKPGTTVKLEVLRDGSILNIDLKLDARPDITAMAEQMPGRSRGILGMRVETLTDEARERLGLETDAQGVFVADVEPDSPADEAGIMHGDIITEVAKKAITNSAEFRARVDRVGKSGKLPIRYIRGDAPPRITVITVPEK